MVHTGGWFFFSADDSDYGFWGFKLLNDASYLKACCPKMSPWAEVLSFLVDRMLRNSHFAFIPIHHWKKLLSSPLPPLFSNQSTYMVTSLCCIPWMLQSLPGFVRRAAFLGLLLPLKTRVWVGSEVISCPCLLCWGLGSGHVGVGKIFYELELKSFRSVCTRVILGLVVCFLFLWYPGAKGIWLSKSSDSRKLEGTEMVTYQQRLKMHVAKRWEILNLFFFESMRN